MSYGLHTERYSDCLAVPSLCEKTGKWERISFEEALKSGKYPAGASYAVSKDGQHFEQSGWLIHAARNPSVYPGATGLKLYAGYAASGVWQAKTMEHPFEKCDEFFDFAGGSIMRNSTECPSFFEWNGYRYLLIGFTGYFRTEKNSDEYFDAAAAGEPIYEGLCVPMVTSFFGNRRMVAGWLNGAGWASVVVHRELIQEEKGRLGMKWVEETLSELKNGKAETVSMKEGCPLNGEAETAYLELELHLPKNGKAALVFLNEQKEGCELQWDAARGRMQFADAQKDGADFALPLDTVLEKMQKADPAIRDFHPLVGNDTPQSSVNFALSDIPFEESNRVRLIISYIRRLNSSVIDVEFAGKLTAVSLRNGLRVKTVRALTENAEFTGARLIRTPVQNRDVLARFFANPSHS